MPRANIRYSDVIAEHRAKEFDAFAERMKRSERRFYYFLSLLSVGMLVLIWWLS